MDARHIQDRERIQRIRKDDHIALADLLRTHAEWLTRSAMRIVGTSDLAQDVVQDVFVWLWNNRATLDIHGSVASYLYRAVRNRAQNVAVHEQAQRNIEARTLAGYDHKEPRIPNAAEADLDTGDFYAALDRALATLSPRTREIFLLRAENGLTYAEIAEAFDIGVPTVHTQMYRATRALAERLQGWLSAWHEGKSG